MTNCNPIVIGASLMQTIFIVTYSQALGILIQDQQKSVTAPRKGNLTQD